MITVDGNEIRTGQELKDILGPERWNEFVGCLAADLAGHVLAVMKNDGY